jgi:hypothetical protein
MTPPIVSPRPTDAGDRPTWIVKYRIVSGFSTPLPVASITAETANRRLPGNSTSPKRSRASLRMNDTGA